MKTGKELRPGTVLRIDNDPWLVLSSKSGSDGAIVKSKLNNLLTGSKTDAVFAADDKLDDVVLDDKEVTLAYISGNIYVWLDTTDDTMYELNAEDIGAALAYIVEGMREVCVLTMYEERALWVALPTTVSRQIGYTENASTSSNMKPAKLTNGTEVQVADAIQIGDWIDIDTRDGSFKGRTKG
ncbi:elongation factor P [Streptomyces sp. 5-8]|uniref:Elongation factor P n=1 Tax=Streptomyces musisoli TaxID=2802280 RepID=A0ABS1PC13_9ACTN|nr:elongation factor P [Streptomyces musisoli]MBL1109907.1 elongation factor P [Streptomyces musisoli]